MKRASSSLGGSRLEIGVVVGVGWVRDGDGFLGCVRMGVSERCRRRGGLLYWELALGAQRELRRSPILGTLEFMKKKIQFLGVDESGGDIVHGPLE